jgi:hypothetical protein
VLESENRILFGWNVQQADIEITEEKGERT